MFILDPHASVPIYQQLIDLHRDLTDMLQSHEANIARANEALKAGG